MLILAHLMPSRVTRARISCNSAVEKIASYAGVFRGARVSWGGMENELPSKRLRGRLWKKLTNEMALEITSLGDE